MIEVDDPSILEDFTGVLMHSHSDNIKLRLCLHVAGSIGPEVKNHQCNVVNLRTPYLFTRFQ